MKNILIILSFLMSFNSFAQNKKSFLRDGNKLYADSSYNEAEMQYRKSLEKDQDYFNASFNLADAVYKQERYEESSALFDALKDNAPTETDLAKVYHNLGNSLVKEQKLEEAIDAYKSSLRINPKDKDTRHNLAITHKQKKQQQEQENKDEKDEQEQDKEGENKEEEKENKEQEQSQENKEQQEEKKESKPEEKKEEMSKETAEKMLEAIQQKEKELQEELQKKKVKGKRVKVLKDW
jgi:Ca-activated chloride channel family protein